MGLSPLAAGLLLAALALLITGYLYACERFPSDPGDGPWLALVALLALAPDALPAQTGTENGAGLESLSAGADRDGREPAAQPLLLSGFVPGAFGGTPRDSRSVLSYRDASRQAGTGWAMTVAAPAGESQPKGDAAGEAGPAPDGAPGAPAASLRDLSAAPAAAQGPRGASVPVEKIADAFGRDLAWIAAGTSADLLSTSAALRWCSTCREGNPLGWDSEARVALKLGVSTAAGTGCWWLRRSGHGRTALIVRWTVFGVQALAAASNARHAIRGR